MKKMRTKVLSILLTSSLAFSCAPAAAISADTTDAGSTSDDVAYETDSTEEATGEVTEEEMSGTTGSCVWSINDGVLYFAPEDGESGMLGSYTDYGKAPWYAYADDITGVEILDGVSAGDSLSWFFYGLSLAQYIHFPDSFDTSSCSSMQGTFMSCSSLTEIDGLEAWDTSNVEDFSNMFYDCYSLTSADVSGWEVTSNCTELYQMFHACYEITALDLSGWDVSNVISFDLMFYYCSELAELDITGWDTSNAYSMASTFMWCSSLDEIGGIEDINTSNVRSMKQLFHGCSSLTSLDLSGWDTSSVTNMGSLFEFCSSLTSLDLSGWDTSNVTNMSFMFYDLRSLKTLDLSSFDTSSVEESERVYYGNGVVADFGMYKMFSRTYELRSITFGENFAFNSESAVEGGIPAGVSAGC